MDDLKLFYNSKEQMYTLVRTVHAFSTDIVLEFGMNKMRNFDHKEMEGSHMWRNKDHKLWCNEGGQKGRMHIFGHRWIG